MVRVSGVTEDDVKYPNSSSLRLPPGLEDVHKEPFHDFLMDITEVTNEDSKQFVYAGGDRSASFWNHTFVQDGQVLSCEDAIPLFTDRTGEPGPVNWEVSDFPKKKR